MKYINDLPNEVLTRIFRLTVLGPFVMTLSDICLRRGNSNSNTLHTRWLRIRWVCTFWRDIINGDSWFWSSIDTSSIPEYLELQFSQVGRVPLSLRARSSELESGSPTLSRIRSIPWQLDSLTIILDSTPPSSTVIDMCLSELKHLSITTEGTLFYSSDTSFASTWDFVHPHHLSFLDIHTLYFPVSLLPQCQVLRSLIITTHDDISDPLASASTPAPAVSITELRNAIQVMPLLEHIGLTGHLASGKQSHPHIVLPHLLSCSFDGDANSAASFLSMISAPRLRHSDLQVSAEGLHPAAETLVRHHCSLMHLFISKVDIISNVPFPRSKVTFSGVSSLGPFVLSWSSSAMSAMDSFLTLTDGLVLQALSDITIRNILHYSQTHSPSPVSEANWHRVLIRIPRVQHLFMIGNSDIWERLPIALLQCVLLPHFRSDTWTALDSITFIDVNEHASIIGRWGKWLLYRSIFYTPIPIVGLDHCHIINPEPLQILLPALAGDLYWDSI